MSFSYVENENTAKLKVIGVGGGGGNAVNNMISSELDGVKFIVANTDLQDLHKSQAEIKIQIGESTTQGLGAGSDPEIGRASAEESIDKIQDSIQDANMVFIAAGMGGGTGTGAAPVIAKKCKEMDILTVAIVTKPFHFEGPHRKKQAASGLEELKKAVDTIVTIPNDSIIKIASKNATVKDMFAKADEILLQSVKGISDLILKPGFINLDFADVKKIMKESGTALMGIGSASGDNRAIEAAEKAITHPLLEDISVRGAKGVLVNITASEEIGMDELNSAMERIYKETGEEAHVIWGQAVDNSLDDQMQVTVIATGISEDDGSGFNQQYDSMKSMHSFQNSESKQNQMTNRIRPSHETSISNAEINHSKNAEHPISYAARQRNTTIEPTSKIEGENYPLGDNMSFKEKFEKPAILRQKNKDSLELPTFFRKAAD